MKTNFDALPWHDASFLELSIDRRDPGEHDEIHVHVVWPDGNAAILIFSDCYALSAEMNFGVIADEQVANAEIVEDDPGLAVIRERWGRLGVVLDQMHCYQIETASTASVIKIYANDFYVAD